MFKQLIFQKTKKPVTKQGTKEIEVVYWPFYTHKLFVRLLF